ncbi:MAG: lysophospholipid acyltransferase family protein [Anaerolineae bacterium]
MISDRFYHFWVGVLDAFLWGGELVGEEHLPEKGPAVFVANHLGAWGPIAVMASMPTRLYPWIIGEMMDPARAADYLNMDFTEKQLHLRPPLSVALSRLLTKITIPMFEAMGCIPVWQGEKLHETYRQSVEYLRAGKCLLIFPEDPHQPLDGRYKMSPFMKGFTRLGELYYQQMGECLRFYPLSVHAETYRVQVGKPVSFNPNQPLAQERLRLKSVLEASVREMYWNMCLDGYLSVPLPR